MRKLSRARLAIAILAALVIALAWIAVLRTRSGLVVREARVAGVPMTYLAPQAARDTPGILIAHGFGGSRQLMLGYATVLARAGFAVVLWDFAGHAANVNRLDDARAGLDRDLDRAYDWLLSQPEVDPTRVGLLGHSMGGGAVLRAGIERPQRYLATVAVSSVNAAVTVDRPRNLLLQAGEWEPRFVSGAEALLSQAGGPNDAMASGRARALMVVPRVEHILILFSRQSHEAALDWFGRAFGVSSASTYVDRRLAWYGVQAIAALALLVALAPALTAAAAPASVRRRRAIAGLLPAPLLAAGLVAFVNRVLTVAEIAGLVVGGGLALWFLFLGGIWLFVEGRPSAPSWRAVWRGLALFAFLWLSVGALAQLVWLPWFLIPQRLLAWLPLALLCFPWLLAAGQAQAGQPARVRLAWWLAQTVMVIAGLLLLIALAPDMGVLVLILPVLPVLLGVMALAGAVADHAWAYALGNALFFGWLLLAYFPLA